MAFKKTKISLSATGHFSKLILEYISAEANLIEFYEYAPTIESFSNAISNTQNNAEPNRELLVTILKEQYQQSGINTVDNNIDLLVQKNTFTVCTGHQLCLFTGPLYFIYKIISTINLAESLKKRYPEYNFLPVYWMASEDHDFEEINNIHLFGKTIAWDNIPAKGAVGKLKTDSLISTINELKQLLGESEQAKELIQLFSDSYLKHTNLANATRYLVHQLFGCYNLVIVDGDDRRLKNEFSEIMKDDILNNTNYPLIAKTIDKLEVKGIKPQVNPREINCFYMDTTVRERIVYNKNIEEYEIVNTSLKFSKEELLSELKNNPQKFSPNVVLRPLYQQKILPNLAYVGGPGEIAYWLEYKTMFNFHKINFPVLLPRNFALIVDEKTAQQFQKMGFEQKDIFKDTDFLIKEFITKHADSSLFLDKEEEKIKSIFSEIMDKAIVADFTLKATVEGELQKTLKAIKTIEGKLLRSEKTKQESGIQQLKKIKDKLFPDANLQERYDTITPYYLKQGKGIIADLKSEFNPFDFDLMLLQQL